MSKMKGMTQQEALALGIHGPFCAKCQRISQSGPCQNGCDDTPTPDLDAVLYGGAAGGGNKIVNALLAAVRPQVPADLDAVVARLVQVALEFAEPTSTSGENQIAADLRTLLAAVSRPAEARGEAKMWTDAEFCALYRELWPTSQPDEELLRWEGGLKRLGDAVLARYTQPAPRPEQGKPSEAPSHLEALRPFLSVGETEDGEYWGIWCISKHQRSPDDEKVAALYFRGPSTEEEERKREAGDADWGPDVDAMLKEMLTP